MTTLGFGPVVAHHHARRRARLRAMLAGLAGAGGIAAAGALGAALVEPAAPMIVSVPPAVVVAAPAAPRVEVNVDVPPPAPPPAPAPPVPERPPPPPRAHARAPMIIVECAVGHHAHRPRACDWHPGFPAISADGETIATYDSDPSPSAEPSGFSIVLHDVATARRVRTIRVITQAEVDAWRAVLEPYRDPRVPDFRRLRARVTRRAEAAQRLLDAGNYRALEHLGTWYASDGDGSDGVEVDRSRTYAEIDHERVRAIDPVTNRVLWQGRFASRAPKGVDPEGDCGAWGVTFADVSWDPTARVAVVVQSYRTGG